MNFAIYVNNGIALLNVHISIYGPLTNSCHMNLLCIQIGLGYSDLSYLFNDEPYTLLSRVTFWLG